MSCLPLRVGHDQDAVKHRAPDPEKPRFAAAFFPSHSNTYLVYTELSLTVPSGVRFEKEP